MIKLNETENFDYVDDCYYVELSGFRKGWSDEGGMYASKATIYILKNGKKSKLKYFEGVWEGVELNKTNKMFAFYDKQGKLSLKSRDMVLDLLDEYIFEVNEHNYVHNKIEKVKLNTVEGLDVISDNVFYLTKQNKLVEEVLDKQTQKLSFVDVQEKTIYSVATSKMIQICMLLAKTGEALLFSKADLLKIVRGK